MILGVVFFVGSFVIYFQFIQPEYGETFRLKGAKASQQSFLEKEKKAIDTVKQLIGDYSTKNEKIQQTVSLVLPTEPDIAGAVAQLYGLSQNNNLEFSSVSITISGLSNTASQQMNLSDVSGLGLSELEMSGLNPSNFKAALERPIGTLTLTTALTGSYNNFKVFLSQLQTNIRIFSIVSLGVSPIRTFDKDKNPLPIEKYTFSIAVSTYYQSQ